jgi:hypothetical protein
MPRKVIPHVISEHGDEHGRERTDRGRGGEPAAGAAIADRGGGQRGEEGQR